MPARDRISQFKGLLLCEVIEPAHGAPAGSPRRLLAYWSDDGVFAKQKSAFQTAYGLTTEPTVGNAVYQEWPRERRWTPAKIAGAVATAAAFVIALTTLSNFIRSLLVPAEPLTDVLTDRRDVRINERFEIPFTIGNLSSTSATAEVEDATLSGSPAQTFQIRWRKAALNQGEYKDNSVAGKIGTPGEYSIATRGHMKAGFLRAASGFDVSLPVKVWARGIAAQPPSPAEAFPSQQTCTAISVIEVGRTVDHGFECAVTLAPSADLKFRYADGPGMRFTPGPSASTPGREVITGTLDGTSTKEFTARRVTIGMIGATPRDREQCATFVQRLQLDCTEKTP